MDFLWVLLVVALVAAFWTINKKIKSNKKDQMAMFKKMIHQTKNQSELFEKQLENEGQQVLLAKESVDRMTELAVGMSELSNDMKEIKSDLTFIKHLLVEPEEENGDVKIALSKKKILL